MTTGWIRLKWIEKLHNLEGTEVVVKSDRLATLVAKEVEYDDLMKKYDELKRKYNINNKKLKKKTNKEHEKITG